jgi:hypothetical protein
MNEPAIIKIISWILLEEIRVGFLIGSIKNSFRNNKRPLLLSKSSTACYAMTWLAHFFSLSFFVLLTCWWNIIDYVCSTVIFRRCITRLKRAARLFYGICVDILFLPSFCLWMYVSFDVLFLLRIYTYYVISKWEWQDFSLI